MKPAKHWEAPHTHGPLDHHSAATQHVRRLRTSLPTANPVQSPLVHSPPATSILCSGDLRPEPRHLRFLPVDTPRTFSRFTASLSPPRPRFQPLFHLLAPGFSASPSQPPPPGFSPPAAATRYKEARNSISLAVARPRWLMLFFSSSGISAKVSSYPSGRNTGS